MSNPKDTRKKAKPLGSASTEGLLLVLAALAELTVKPLTQVIGNHIEQLSAFS